MCLNSLKGSEINGLQCVKVIQSMLFNYFVYHFTYIHDILVTKGVQLDTPTCMCLHPWLVEYSGSLESYPDTYFHCTEKLHRWVNCVIVSIRLQTSLSFRFQFYRFNVIEFVFVSLKLLLAPILEKFSQNCCNI